MTPGGQGGSQGDLEDGGAVILGVRLAGYSAYAGAEVEDPAGLGGQGNGHEGLPVGGYGAHPGGAVLDGEAGIGTGNGRVG